MRKAAKLSLDGLAVTRIRIEDQLLLDEAGKEAPMKSALTPCGRLDFLHQTY